jgi:predicted tellurium resistance membrane protein TerC
MIGAGLTALAAWRMWRDLFPSGAQSAGRAQAATGSAKPGPAGAGRALAMIVVIDVASSLDTTVAVAGAARHAPALIVFGLVFSMLLLGAAGSHLARLMEGSRALAALGLCSVVITAAGMGVEATASLFPGLWAPGSAGG